MYVNAFWLGFLMAILAVLVLLMVMAFVNVRRREDEEAEEDEEYQRILAKMDGKNFFVMTRDGYLVGSEVPDKEDGKDGT